ncbi:hypothetical protein QE250_14450 [Chromatiaceae bacterium AAb-1]|nr:hypothetical protein [Chromatiaceae bacterium AAb-1]
MIRIIYTLVPVQGALPFQWLTKDEQLYCQQLAAKRLRQFCYGRALLRKHLCAALTLAVDDIRISLPSEQAPALTVNGRPYQLSISHSDALIAVAYSAEHPVGLDVEMLKPRKDWQSLAAEFPALAGTADDIRAFYQRWTQCEAYSKFSGEPLFPVLNKPLPSFPAFFCLPLGQYMLCLCYQHADTTISITEECL